MTHRDHYTREWFGIGQQNPHLVLLHIPTNLIQAQHNKMITCSQKEHLKKSHRTCAISQVDNGSQHLTMLVPCLIFVKNIVLIPSHVDIFKVIMYLQYKCYFPSRILGAIVHNALYYCDILLQVQQQQPQDVISANISNQGR